jgi:hypothetical protein
VPALSGRASRRARRDAIGGICSSGGKDKELTVPPRSSGSSEWDGDPTSLVILRVSKDPRFVDGLRIYVRLVNDVSRGFETSRVVSDIDGALEVMRAWLTCLSTRDGIDHS